MTFSGHSNLLFDCVTIVGNSDFLLFCRLTKDGFVQGCLSAFAAAGDWTAMG